MAGFGLAGLGTLAVTGEAGASLVVGGLVAVVSVVAWARWGPAVEGLVAGSGWRSGSGEAEAASAGRSVAMYKALVRRFAQDGGLSRAEERALANMADQLGLEPGRAFALRMEEGGLDGDAGDTGGVGAAGDAAWPEAGSGHGGGAVEDVPGAEPADGGGTQALVEEDGPASPGNGAAGESGVEAASEEGDGDGDEGGSEGPGSEEGLEGRLDLRRNAETGEVEMVIHETPWGDVRVDLGKVPRED